MSEQIPACDDFAAKFRNVKRFVSSDWIDTEECFSLLVEAQLAAEACHQACSDVLNADGEVIDPASEFPLAWSDIDERLYMRLKILRGYGRIAQNRSFEFWAGSPLSIHDSEPTIAEVFDEKLNYVKDRHAVRDHVGIKHPDLAETREHKQQRANSTFHNYKIAEYAIGRALAFYWEDITVWLGLTETSEPDWWKRNKLQLPDLEMSRDLGYAIKRRRSKEHITTKVRVIIIRDEKAPRGFWIKDAYPTL